MFRKNLDKLNKATWIRTLVVVLAACIIFGTTYAMILPAITLEASRAAEEPGIELMENDGAEAEEVAENEAEEKAAANEVQEPTVGTASESEETAADDAESTAEESNDGEETADASSEQEDQAADEENADEEEDASGEENAEDAEEAEETEEETVSVSDDEETAEDEKTDKDTDKEEKEKKSTDKKMPAVTFEAETDLVKVTAVCEEGTFPKGTTMKVKDVSNKKDILAAIEEAMGGEVKNVQAVDITFFNKEGEEIEPEKEIQVTLATDMIKETDAPVIVHIPDEGSAEVVDPIDEDKLDSRPAEDEIIFASAQFSAYAIVEGPEAIPAEWKKIESISELAEHTEGVYIGHTDGFYFMNTLTVESGRTGITKTKPAQAYPADKAARYYFENAGSENQFYVYCYDKNNNRQYVKNNNNNSLSLGTAEDKTAFTVALESDGSFTVHNGAWYWNMQGGANGKRFCSYNNAGDTNNKLYFWYNSEITSDPYELDGKAYGLMNWNGGAAGKAMMAASSKENALDAKALTVMTKRENNKEYKLFVPNNSDISMWTFHWVNEDQYYLTADIDGSLRYLKVGANGLSLVSAQEDASQIRVIPGSGAHAGEICLKSGNNTLTYSGELAEGFGVGGSTGSEWMRFVELSELTEDYFRTYSANKVSVSDTDTVKNGEKIIVYTRNWNETLKKYEFFAIDGKGNLIPCYESGDSIEWVGGQLNTLLWDFVEYYYEGTTTPNHYYELYNQYRETYIAPQVTDGQIISDDPIGINLNGRRNGQYYTTILAWDDANYAYAGLKVENGKIVSCPKSEAMDFYFAKMEDIPVDDVLHTVPTVDHTQYGITMKLVDFATREEMSTFLGNDEGGAVKYTQPGLLSTGLDANGYPTAAGGSLGTLYSGAREVNHLFINSTFQASGYYEFDSAQNFASLNYDGTFKVYKELGSYDSGGNKPTLKHGQFFPFNDLEPGVFASVNGKNQYSATAQLLPDSDPRKNEQLYLIKNVDCYYGMEVEASFVQTPDGLDDWNHDIIFEFSGDDDFWLYVDGELVIDLGGIHSALPGSVNFRTGEVNVNGKRLTLRDLFYDNYIGRGHTAAEAQAYIDKNFKQNKDGQWVFQDNTTHTMKIFYMERGAGAANLHMRFNLSSIKPGTVLLSKELSGVDESEMVLAEFPYQIKYQVKVKESGSSAERIEERVLTNSTRDGSQDVDDHVFYKGTINPVTFKDSLTIRDGEAGDLVYTNVFMLKPGEEAEISFPELKENEELVGYQVIECGVNTDVYERVTVNGDEDAVSAEAVEGHPNRKDYVIQYDTAENRAKVAYVNQVNEDALRNLEITKKLYREDGVTELHNDASIFSFRLYLATEFDGNLNEMAADMHTYHVKDADGNYCRWNEAQQVFESIGKTDYTTLTAAEKEAVSFVTSMNGSISKIPAFYTVEIRNILAGTQYRVEERAQEIPDGYSFQKYEKDATARIEDNDGVSGVVDTIAAGIDSRVGVCNLKGWGLRVKKVWTDKEYMADREAAYFAVFTRNERDELTLVSEPNTVRQLAYGEETLYWYFVSLPVSGISFDRYEIREVTLSNATPTVDADGVVTDYGTVTPVEEGGSVSFNGRQKGEETSSAFTYTVHYEKGMIEDGSNVRVDTVTNDRPGIVIRKQNWTGNALSGAAFTLMDGENLIGTFISDAEGLITIAYLRNGADYTLIETKAPQGYHGPEADMMIRLTDGTVVVSGVDESYYEVRQANADGEETVSAELIVKNRPYTFRVVKKDWDSKASLAGVHFELHREITVGGVTSFDLNPMIGYEDLVTDENGILQGLDETLREGTYELRETSTPDGYQTLPSYIHFTKSETGAVSLGSNPEGVTLAEEVQQDGTLAYELTVLNKQLKKVSFKKVDIADPYGSALEGAKFDLYEVVNGSRKTPALYTGLTSDMNGMLVYKESGSASGITVFELPAGTYHLVETEAPEGYQRKTEPVVVIVTSTGITYDEGTNLSASGNGAEYHSSTGVCTLLISNSSGYALPSAGGIGTKLFYIIGGLMAAGAAVLLIGRRRIRG